MSLRNNVIANYLGQGWRALMTLAFIPFYVRYLGIEAFGLIGLFAILQAWLALVDMGMKPALAREMARFVGGAHDAQKIRDLLRSVEVIGLCIAVAIMLGVWGASGWIANRWLAEKSLSADVVAGAVSAMGIIAALSFLENIYVSSIAGLQRQVLQNMVVALMATLRGVGAVAVLAWISPTIEGFFVWQGLVSVLSLSLFAILVYRALPPSAEPARFSRAALFGIWRFAAGMMAITFLALLLTQVDKMLLSRLLSLEAFGYYALAGVITNGLYMLVGPIAGAFYPRFTELVTRGDSLALSAAYHQGAQLVTVVLGTAAIVLMAFGERILVLWTSDAALASKVAPLMAVMALGALLNGLLWVPYQMQLAHGWTTLAVKINFVAVCLLVPAILWIVPRHGAIGAAWAWVALNAGYLLIPMHLMYRRLLVKEKWRWYVHDLLLPLLMAGTAAWLCRWTLPSSLNRIVELSLLVMYAGLILVLAALAAPLVRAYVAQVFLSRDQKMA